MDVSREKAKLPFSGWKRVFTGLSLTMLIIYAILSSQKDPKLSWRPQPHNYVAPLSLNAQSREAKSAKKCLPVKNVVYVKTHKTASSTIQGIITKYTRMQSTVFPRPYLGGYPGTFRREFVTLRQFRPNGSSEKLRAIAGHFRFNKTEIEDITSPNCKYITILRDPVHQFESTFNYYYGRFGRASQRFNKVSCFGEPYLQVTKSMGIDLPDYLEMASERLNDDMAWFFRSHNYQSFDLGMNQKILDDESIQKYINELEDRFDLVMISDYFLESLILLKETLCMEWKDLTFTSVQTGRYKKRNFTSREINLLRKINKQDFMLYQHFNRTFWKKVDQYGTGRMKKDVEKLTQILSNSSKDKKKGKRKGRSVKARRSRRSLEAFNATSMPSIHEDRKKHVDVLKARIFRECNYNGICRSDALTERVANVMIDNSGWCPH